MSRAALAGQERAAAHRLSRARLAGLAWAALTVVIFSGWFVVTRFSVTRELRVWDITALRFGIGAVLLAPALFRAGARLPPMAWRRGLAFSLLWGAPFVLCVALGLQLTSAAQAATIAPTLMPVFAGLFAWAFLRERQAPIRWFGYVAIALGLVCLVIAWAVAHGPPNPGRDRRPRPRRRDVGGLYAPVPTQRTYADPVGGADLPMVGAALPAGISRVRSQPPRPGVARRDRIPGRVSGCADERRRDCQL